MPYIIALSGAVASGKSALSDALVARLRAQVLSTRGLIKALRDAADDRGALQFIGDALDAATTGKWVADGAERFLAELPIDTVVVVDAVRKPMQVERLRERWPRRVHHVHLKADADELERRYVARLGDARESKTYAQVKADPTEAAIETMAGQADAVISTEGLNSATLAECALAGTPFARSRVEQLVDVIVGAQYGSEGKGNVCAAIAREYEFLMRVGGPNAGHVVHHPEFTFRHLPSGTIANPSAQLLIGPGATISPEILMGEILSLRELSPPSEVDGARLSIDPRAMVIERGDCDREGATLDAIASTKQGVGAAAARRIMGRGAPVSGEPPVRLVKNVPALATFARRVDSRLEEAFARGALVLLEGTQGTGLSLHHGEWPHVTSRDTTVAGCLSEAGIAPQRVRRVILVVRSWPIRVGGPSGPFANGVTDWETVAQQSGLPLYDLLNAEKGSVSGNQRRVGNFSIEQVKQAAILNGATNIALTFADQIDAANATATTAAGLTEKTKQFVRKLEIGTGLPVTWIVKGKLTTDVLRTGAES